MDVSFRVVISTRFNAVAFFCKCECQVFSCAYCDFLDCLIQVYRSLCHCNYPFNISYWIWMLFYCLRWYFALFAQEMYDALEFIKINWFIYVANMFNWSSDFIQNKKTGHLFKVTRLHLWNCIFCLQPGYLFQKTRGFPSLPCDRFGYKNVQYYILFQVVVNTFRFFTNIFLYKDRTFFVPLSVYNIGWGSMDRSILRTKHHALPALNPYRSNFEANASGISATWFFK